MTKKIFVTLFEKVQNVHLTKDVGQIAYFMHKKFNYNATLIGHKTDNSYPLLKELKGLKLTLLPKIKIGRISLSLLIFLLFNSKKIDVLHLFHHATKTYLYAIVYKFLNKNGFLYIKSDVVLQGLLEYRSFMNPRYKLRNFFFHKAMKITDIVSVETKKAYELINQFYPQYKHKFIHLPNGADIQNAYQLSPLKSFEQKENMIITVGRIGAFEKNHELFLEAISKIDLKEWKVVMVGPIEEKFQNYLSNFFKNFPALKDKIILTGNITSKKELFNYYNNAKVFCLTSISEGSPLVFPEALAYGNFILSTNVGGVEDIILNNKFGRIISDNDSLSVEITRCMGNENLLKNAYEESILYAQQNFEWATIVEILEQRINS